MIVGYQSGFQKFQNNPQLLYNEKEILTAFFNKVHSQVEKFEKVSILEFDFIITLLTKYFQNDFSNFEVFYFTTLLFRYLSFESDNTIEFQVLYQFIFCHRKQLSIIKQPLSLKTTDMEQFLELTHFLYFSLQDQFQYEKFNKKIEMDNQLLFDIQKCLYNQQTRKLYYMSNHSLSMAIHKNRNLYSKKINFPTLQLKENITNFNIFTFQHQDYLAIMTNQRNMMIYNLKKLYLQVYEHQFQLKILYTFYSEEIQCLITINYEGQINCYRVELSKKKEFILSTILKIKTGLYVLDYALIYQTTLIAICVGKTQIFFYDLKTGKQVKIIQDEFSLRFISFVKLKSCDMKQPYLLSYGPQSVIYLWDPDLNLQKNLMGKLNGHKGNILDVQWIFGYNEVISLDSKLEVLVWNIKLLQIIYSVKLDQNIYQSSIHRGNIVLGKEEEVWILAHHLFVLQQNSTKIKNSQIILDIIYDFQNEEFIVINEKFISYYSSINGDLKRKYATLFTDMTIKITKFQLLKSKRLFFILDSHNDFYIYQEFNCMKIIQLTSTNFKDFYALEGSNFILIQNQNLSFELFIYNSKEINYFKSLIVDSFPGNFFTGLFVSHKEVVIAGFQKGRVLCWSTDSVNDYYNVINYGKENIVEMKFIDTTQQLCLIMNDQFRIWILEIQNRNNNSPILYQMISINLSSNFYNIVKIHLYQSEHLKTIKYLIYILQKSGQYHILDITSLLPSNLSLKQRIYKLSTKFNKTSQHQFVQMNANRKHSQIQEGVLNQRLSTYISRLQLMGQKDKKIIRDKNENPLKLVVNQGYISQKKLDLDLIEFMDEINCIAYLVNNDSVEIVAFYGEEIGRFSLENFEKNFTLNVEKWQINQEIRFSEVFNQMEKSLNQQYNQKERQEMMYQFYQKWHFNKNNNFEEFEDLKCSEKNELFNLGLQKQIEKKTMIKKSLIKRIIDNDQTIETIQKEPIEQRLLARQKYENFQMPLTKHDYSIQLKDLFKKRQAIFDENKLFKLNQNRVSVKSKHKNYLFETPEQSVLRKQSLRKKFSLKNIRSKSVSQVQFLQAKENLKIQLIRFYINYFLNFQQCLILSQNVVVQEDKQRQQFLKKKMRMNLRRIKTA